MYHIRIVSVISSDHLTECSFNSLWPLRPPISILQTLLDDSLVNVEKIGTSNYYCQREFERQRL